MIHKLIRKIRTKLIISLLYWDLKPDIKKEPATYFEKEFKDLFFKCYCSKKKRIEFVVRPNKWE